MKIGVAAPFGMDKRPFFLVHGGVVGFEPQVEAKQEIGEVHAQADAVGSGYLLVESVETEHASGLVFVVVYGPDVSGIDEYGSFEHPEQFGAVLKAQVEAYVAALVDEVGHGIPGVIRTGTECAHSPASHSVGTAGVEAFLERYHRGISVRVCDTGSDVERQCVPAVEVPGVGIIHLALDILRVLYAEYFIHIVRTVLPYRR